MPMSAPSSVFKVRRTSSCTAPSGRSRIQSEPPGSTEPFNFGPSNMPPVTGTIRRSPSGVLPSICGAPVESEMLNSNAARTSVMRTSSVASSGGVGIHHIQDNRPIVAAEAARARGIETALRDQRALRRDARLARELEGIAQVLTGVIGAEGVLGEAARQHRLHPVVAERAAVGGALG